MTPSAPPRTVSPSNLTPGPDLAPIPNGWEATAQQVRFTAAVPLPPGWYRVRLAITSAGRFAVHKRADLTFDPADGDPRPASRESFTWNRRFDEQFMVRLTRPAAGLRIDLLRADGRFTLDAFDVRPVPGPMTYALAVREKVRLIRAYRCVGPVLLRGSKLLLSGRFGQFRSKLLKGLVDARQMRTGPGRQDEVDAAWWRRHALSGDEADRIARACDAMLDPPPLAVLLPIDPERPEEARLAAHSVRRQIYPHWELLIAAAGPAGMTSYLNNFLGPDPRVKVVRLSPSVGLATAVGKAVGETACGHVLVLPPGVELAEHALYHFARQVKDDPDGGPVGGKVYDDGDGGSVVWLAPTRQVAAAVPSPLLPEKLEDWAAGIAGPTVLDPVLAYPIDDRPLLDRARLGPKPTPPASTLFLGAHLQGISGYDHLVYALVKGLPGVTADLRLHPKGGVRVDLIPPKLLPSADGWEPGAPELLVCPPWLAKRFRPGKHSAIFTMWECDRLDPAAVAVLNAARVVIVPSRWGADCFRASGVTVPIEVAPLGYDPLVFHPNAAPFPEVCTFGTAGALAAGGVRKNTQRVIDLFRQTFPTGDDVRLRVKITPSSPSVETYDDPRIDVIRSVLPLSELADWYRSLTAYVNASAAEGFGLHLIEAMACGRPLVTPSYSGLTAFFDPSVGYPVEYRMVPVGNDLYAGHWADPADDSLAAQLRRVYAGRSEAERFGKLSAARAGGFTWKAAGRALTAALRKHGLLT